MGYKITFLRTKNLKLLFFNIYFCIIKFFTHKKIFDNLINLDTYLSELIKLSTFFLLRLPTIKNSDYSKTTLKW